MFICVILNVYWDFRTLFWRGREGGKKNGVEYGELFPFHGV